jgi:YebC/PmpR family DNA-binding regulatory protein
MSGHSKWNNIKNKKAATDAKKGKVFGYIGRQIRVAVKEGGSGDPNTNPSLRMALEKAREANMPRANVDRAIERGLGKSKGGNVIEEVVYEGYGAGGVGFLVSSVTDNRNRTGAEVRGLFERYGGSLGGPELPGTCLIWLPTDRLRLRFLWKLLMNQLKNGWNR